MGGFLVYSCMHSDGVLAGQGREGNGVYGQRWAYVTTGFKGILNECTECFHIQNVYSGEIQQSTLCYIENCKKFLRPSGRIGIQQKVSSALSSFPLSVNLPASPVLV